MLFMYDVEIICCVLVGAEAVEHVDRDGRMLCTFRNDRWKFW